MTGAAKTGTAAAAAAEAEAEAAGWGVGDDTVDAALEAAAAARRGGVIGEAEEAQLVAAVCGDAAPGTPGKRICQVSARAYVREHARAVGKKVCPLRVCGAAVAPGVCVGWGGGGSSGRAATKDKGTKL